MSLRAGLFGLAVGAMTVLFAGAEASAASGIRLVPANFAFGERVVGMEYSSRHLDIYGTGPSMVEVTDAVLEGTDADQFEFYDFDCIGNEVDENTPCFMTVNFDSAEVGLKNRFDQDRNRPRRSPFDSVDGDRIKATKSGRTGPVKVVKFKVIRRR